MSDTKYTWIKGRIFQRKDETSPFRIGTTGKNENYAKFTLRHSKQLDNGTYENKYFECVAFAETAELIDRYKLNKGDNLLCKAVKKEREYNGKFYTSYTVYDIFRQLEKPKEQEAVNQIKSAVEAVRPQAANQNEFNFDDIAANAPTDGKEVDIPF